MNFHHQWPLLDGQGMITLGNRAFPKDIQEMGTLLLA